MAYDIQKIIKNKSNFSQYREILDSFKKNGDVKDTSIIESTVERAITNLKRGNNRFVIYGEPQSGKTSMMISLVARLMDEGYNKIVILVNDNIQLLDQNLKRFQKAKLKPTPEELHHFHGRDLLKEKSFIIFSKKNSSDLSNVLSLIKRVENILVLDDEADYATPNSKVNKEGEKTKINFLIESILGEAGSYIGVTATPGRLDLNLTLKNETSARIDFGTYEGYRGGDCFFPEFRRCPEDNKKLEYNLNILKDEADYKKELRLSLFRFMVNVAYLNLFKNERGHKNYGMLVHTSYKKDEHYGDLENIEKIFNVFKNTNENNIEKIQPYINEIEKIIDKKLSLYDGNIDENRKDLIMEYIIKEAESGFYKVINSNEKNKDKDIENLTKPIKPFTIAIGGNILSRGLTFDNLLSMFFLRVTKSGKLQQDTYIQMARMFGRRFEYVRYFELNVPESIYSSRRQCFDAHRYSVSLLNKGYKVKWIVSKNSTPVSGASIDKKNTEENLGIIDGDTIIYDQNTQEFGTEKFDYNLIKDLMDNLTVKIDGIKALNLLKDINKILKSESIDDLIGKIKIEDGLMFHPSSDISTHKISDEQKEEIEKGEGLLGNVAKSNQNKNIKWHLRIYYNASGKARLYHYFKIEDLLITKPLIKTIERKKRSTLSS